MGSQMWLQSSCRFFSFFSSCSSKPTVRKACLCQLGSRHVSVYSWLREVLWTLVSHHFINYSRHSKGYLNLEKVQGFFWARCLFLFYKARCLKITPPPPLMSQVCSVAFCFLILQLAIGTCPIWRWMFRIVGSNVISFLIFLKVKVRHIFWTKRNFWQCSLYRCSESKQTVHATVEF